MSKQCKPERLDRLLSRLGYGSRRDVRIWIREGRIEADGDAAVSPAQKVLADAVRLEGERLDHPHGLTLIYHKPVGAVCSHRERGRLIYEDFPERWAERKPPLSSVGRLDKDTSGLLILTDDGGLNHDLTSPRRHISKTYEVSLAGDIDPSAIDTFASGRLMLEDDERPCRPAELEILDTRHVRLTLREGRYHQVRRMFAAIGNHVEALHRSHIGRLSLRETGLVPGAYRSIEPDLLMDAITGRA